LKFEQVLQIYWSKGFLYSGRIIPFQSNVYNFCNEVGGLGLFTKIKILKRFELNLLYTNHFNTFLEYDKDTRKLINILLSQITSVNNQISEIQKYNLIRLYLTKTYRGRAQALGKPSRGQRTWSNAWTAYYYNKTLRSFINTIQKNLNKNKKDEQINYKVVQKKTRKSTKSQSPTKNTEKIKTWF
jgi:ribosomal protein S13